MVKQMWPYIGEYVKKLLKETVEPIVHDALPGQLKPFKFEHIDLGDTVSHLLFKIICQHLGFGKPFENQLSFTQNVWLQ